MTRDEIYDEVYSGDGPDTYFDNTINIGDDEAANKAKQVLSDYDKGFEDFKLKMFDSFEDLIEAIDYDKELSTSIINKIKEYYDKYRDKYFTKKVYEFKFIKEALNNIIKEEQYISDTYNINNIEDFERLYNETESKIKEIVSIYNNASLKDKLYGQIVETATQELYKFENIVSKNIVENWIDENMPENSNKESLLQSAPSFDTLEKAWSKTLDDLSVISDFKQSSGLTILNEIDVDYYLD